MNAKFEWLGFSVARKHVYFYTLLIAATVFVNSMKDQLINHQPDPALSHLQKFQEQMAEAEAIFRE
jgi:hypothetical protein